jgi:hypothetical protein
MLLATTPDEETGPETAHPPPAATETGKTKESSGNA